MTIKTRLEKLDGNYHLEISVPRLNYFSSSASDLIPRTLTAEIESDEIFDADTSLPEYMKVTILLEGSVALLTRRNKLDI